MEFWQAIAFTEPDQLADFARSAEAVGFDGVTTGDHLVTPASIGSTYPYTADGRFWIDPEEELIGVFMVQSLPHRTRLGDEFHVLTYQALVD